MAKKRPSRKRASTRKPSRAAQRNAWDEFQELLGRWREIAESRPGIVSAINASPALRILVENWAGLEHALTVEKLPKSGTAFSRVWAVHHVDMLAASEQIGLDPHVLLRVFERARKLGVIFPDGKLHTQAERYLKELDQFAVVPPNASPR
jgi:hypothetical protein